MDLKKLFGISDGRSNAGNDLGELFAGVQTVLSAYSDSDIKLITAFAGLLGKVAYADMDVSQAEEQRIRSVLSGIGNLKEQQAVAVIELLGKQRARLFSIEDFVYFRLLNDVLDKPGKLDFMKALFTVAAADESVSGDEDATLWTIAKGLRLSHRDFISVRAQFAEHLDVLKPTT